MIVKEELGWNSILYAFNLLDNVKPFLMKHLKLSLTYTLIHFIVGYALTNAVVVILYHLSIFDLGKISLSCNRFKDTLWASGTYVLN